MKVIPLHSNVLIKQQDETETMYGNIIVPDAGHEKPLLGEIIAVGPGIINMNGVLIPNLLEVGQKVIIPPMGPTKVEHDGAEYWICQENMVLAVIKD
jgi:chaperonin GroES